MSQPHSGERSGLPEWPGTPQRADFVDHPPSTPNYAAGTAWAPPVTQQWGPPMGQPWGAGPDGSQFVPQSSPSGRPRRLTSAPGRLGLVSALAVLLVAVALVVLQFTPGRGYARAAGIPRPQVPRSQTQPIPAYPTAVTPKMSDGVVLINGELDDGFSSGTGIVLSDSGLVLTNYHVVAGTTYLTAQPAGGSRNYQADLLGRNIWADVALLQLRGAGGLVTADLAADPVRIGDRVIVVGNGDGGGVLLASGGSVIDIDAAVSLESAFGGYGFDEAVGMIQSTAGAIPGYSGGPTYNDAIQVVGVTSAGQDPDDEEMITYSIPIETATAIAEDIAAGRESEQTRIGPVGWLGVDFGTRNVAVVTAVQQGSPAEMIGLTAGSTINSFDSHPINSASGFLRIAESYDPGDVVVVAWQDEQGQPRETTVTLATSPTN